MTLHRVAIVGYGKIAQDQHVPAIAASPHFELAAVVSRHAKSVPGVDLVFADDAQMLARSDIGCVAICSTPDQRYAAARRAIAAGKAVLLEKPPAATLAEAHALKRLAEDKGVTLFATWHARANPAVVEAARRLKDKRVTRLAVAWKEDVRHWHPGQEWVWTPGGFGVFDPGINALSILTAILPQPIFVRQSRLSTPKNRAAPIAADITFGSAVDGADLQAAFDWRQTGTQTWAITVETDDGLRLDLTEGGAKLAIDGAPVETGPSQEYPDLYARFAELVDARASDVDLRPLELVADAFLRAEQTPVEVFED
jgi:D-galactose 1-dehydrogenase